MRQSKHLLGLLIAIILAFTAWHYWKRPPTARIKINGNEFRIDLAVTPSQRERGLSGRMQLASDEGMLFLFEDPGTFHFWMRGMLFPLDFIWINGNTIVGIYENVPHPIGNEPPIEVAPKVPVDKVLEVNAGTIQTFNINIGDTVEFITK